MHPAKQTFLDLVSSSFCEKDRNRLLELFDLAAKPITNETEAMEVVTFFLQSSKLLPPETAKPLLAALEGVTLPKKNYVLLECGESEYVTLLMFIHREKPTITFSWLALRNF